MSSDMVTPDKLAPTKIISADIAQHPEFIKLRDEMFHVKHRLDSLQRRFDAFLTQYEGKNKTSNTVSIAGSAEDAP